MVRVSHLALLMVTAWAGLAPAHAAPSTQSGKYDVRGNVQSRCATGSSGGVTPLTTAIDKNGKLPANLNNRSFNLAGLFCSSASQIRVSATPLRRSPALSTGSLKGQSQTINYTATATGWSPQPATVTTTMASPIGANTVYVGAPQTLNTAKAASINVTVNNFSIATGAIGFGNIIDRRKLFRHHHRVFDTKNLMRAGEVQMRRKFLALSLAAAALFSSLVPRPPPPP